MDSPTATNAGARIARPFCDVERRHAHRTDRIDILLATYNGARFVERQINSVVEQMSDGCRLVVRDDGSSDDTPAILRRFARQYPDRVIFQEDGTSRLGARGSFSRLLENSDADYVALCDQDDLWLPGHITKPLARIQATEQTLGKNTPVLAHTDLTVADGSLQTIAPSFWRYSRLDPYRGRFLNRLLIQNVVTGCVMMMNRALIRKACPIPSVAPMHDWWIALVAAAFGRIEVLPESTILYRQHGGNHIGATHYNWRYVMHRAKYMLRHDFIAEHLGQTQRQAAAFVERYDADLQPGQRESLQAFLNLRNFGFIQRRFQMLRHGFLRSGILSNLGWLLLI